MFFRLTDAVLIPPGRRPARIPAAMRPKSSTKEVSMNETASLPDPDKQFAVMPTPTLASIARTIGFFSQPEPVYQG
jgi:hypothetical protein